ncbi:phage capsid protein [Fodinicurvata sediminis]|uniref:phage capsid protein n=1 Tax=Fodinicurvata sediminis TaxID=1121832 RepID=UPI0003B3B1AB|nr:phage capsid protein [Fodinicurvata sediminis]
MSEDITTAFVQQYSDGITLLAQQESEETRKAITLYPNMKAEKTSFDQVGLVKMQPRGGRHADIPSVDTPHKRRWLIPTAFHARDFIDEFDQLQMLTDPTNAYTQAFAAAAARTFDKAVIDGALGTNYVGKDGVTQIELPSSQKIAVGGTGFTLDKLKQAVRILKSNHALMKGDELHCFWTARQEEEFIDTTEVKSSDFNRNKVMVDGGVDEFYRVRFHLLEDVDDTEDGRMLPKDGNTRSIPLFTKSGIRYGEPKPPYGNVAWLPEKESWQVSGGVMVAACRDDERKVVQIDVDES